MPEAETSNERNTATQGCVESYLGQLTEIPVALPPNLMTLINYPGRARFVAINYFGTKATWHDGIASSTFSYYAAYEPLINHPAMYLHLMDVDLGHDDTQATHALVCDRQDNKFYVGDLGVVRRLLTSQFPEQPDEETIAHYHSMFAALVSPASVSDLQNAGMFEFLLGASREAGEAGREMIAWLDNYITEELVNKYKDMLAGNDIRAYIPLSYLESMMTRGAQDEFTDRMAS